MPRARGVDTSITWHSLSLLPIGLPGRYHCQSGLTRQGSPELSTGPGLQMIRNRGSSTHISPVPRGSAARIDRT